MPQYEYYGLMAEAWDLLRGDTSRWADRFLFLELVKQYGEPVLDIGCGTGRILLDYLQQGIDIEGVDNSPEMLAILERKAQALGLEPTFYLQEVQQLNLARQYSTILVPSSSFQLVVEQAAAHEALRRLYAHLKPGGALVMPFYINRFDEPAPRIVVEDWHLHQEAQRPEDGATIRRWLRITYDLEEKLEHTEDRYEVLVNGEIVESEEHAWSPATRWYTQAEARELYAEAGFVDIKMFSEFSKNPADPEDTLFTVIGVKPQED